MRRGEVGIRASATCGKGSGVYDGGQCPGRVRRPAIGFPAWAGEEWVTKVWWLW